MVTRAQHQQRIKAASAGGKSKRLVGATGGYDAAAVAKRMMEYDKKCGKVEDWQTAEKREKTEAQVILNEQRRIEVETAAGRLITPEVHEKKLEELGLKCAQQIDRLPEVLAEMAPASERKEWRKIGKTASQRINNAIAEAFK